MEPGKERIYWSLVNSEMDIKGSKVRVGGDQNTKIEMKFPLALAIGSVFIYEIFTVLPFTFNNVSSISALLNIFTTMNSLFLNSQVSNITTIDTALNPVIADSTFTNFLQIQAIGQGLYTYGAVWLILCSVILLLSMVAPIFISRIAKK